MKRIEISVAMCTFNGAKYLREQLESIAVQTRLPDELIVCDDNSTDGTVEVILNFAAHAPFPVRLEINTRNLGSTKNFERAISFCQGEVVALADQDDVWNEQKLETIYGSLEEYPEIGYVFSDAELIDDLSNQTGKNLWQSIGFSDSLRGEFVKATQPAILLRRNVVTGATMAFRSCLNSVLLPFSPYFVHDGWIAIIASCVGWPGLPICEPLIRYRQHCAQQLGVRPRSFLEKVRWARLNPTTNLSDCILAFQDARSRLSVAEQLGHKLSESHTRLVDEKILHCAQRLAMHSKHGVAKVGNVVLEMLTGRYHRFSNSWQSAAKDLCF